jgi:hypothetical protein
MHAHLQAEDALSCRHFNWLLILTCYGVLQTHLFYRGRASVGSLLFFTVGEFLLVALAVGLPAWGHLAIAAGAINAAALLLFPFIPESARWLLSQGKQQQATQLLQAIASANGSCMPQQPLVCSKESEDGSSEADAQSHCSYSEAGSSNGDGRSRLGLMAVLRSRSLPIRSVVLLITWYALLQVGVVAAVVR